jgi:LCP family protein required for cell wall assembly
MANSVEKFPRQINLETRQNPTGDPPTPKNPGKPYKMAPFYKGLLWGTTFSITATISAIIGASITLFSPLALKVIPIFQSAGQAIAGDAHTSEQTVTGSVLQYQLSRPVNILVMGIDRVPDAKDNRERFNGRSDTMLLLRFNPEDKSIRMLSIPRDTRVVVPRVGYTKINDANVYGGPALAAKVISNTLNDVPIDRYVRVTTDAFVELVDLVGGVEVFVPEKMFYRDVTQNLEINLEAGWQTLNGGQAEQFARFRSDQYGDIGRVQRQQILLKALQKRITSPAMISKIPEAMNIIQQYLDTNLSIEEMLALANFGQELTREDIKMVMLPGRFSVPEEYGDQRSYWVIYRNQQDRVMQEYFDLASSGDLASPSSFEPNYNVRIAIQNAADDPGLANRVAEYLAKHNYKNIYIITESRQLLRETEIVTQKGDIAAAEHLKTKLGLGRVESSSIGDLDSDLTLRIGIDAKQLLRDDSFLKSNQSEQF